MKYNKNEVTGKMRDRIILQNVTRVRSLTGFASEIWTDTTTIWAFAESKLPGSNETIIEGKNTAKNICDFTIRYISSITEESRVVFKNKIYQVKNIKISHDRRFISFQGVYYDSYSTVFGLQFCSASLLAQSSLSAALMRVIKYQASLNAFGTLTGDINFVQNMQAALLTSSSVTGNIIIPKLVQASLTGAGTTAANLTVGGAFDADAQAFFDRVTTAGGTLTTTEQNAVNTLVVQMKADGIWTKMKAIYPMVGASAAACRQNLKSASFTGTFSSGWTFANTGATPNGTSAFMNTGLNPVAQGLNSANSHLSYYCQTTSTTSDPAEIGNFTGSSEGFVLQSAGESNSIRFFYSYSLRATFGTLIRPLGLISGSSTNGNNRRDIYRNGVSIGFNNTIDNASLGNYNLYLGAGNINNTSVASYSNSRCAFASIGEGLSSTDMSNFYTAVQAFQTTLNRQV